jgi:hypothetical protein
MLTAETVVFIIRQNTREAVHAVNDFPRTVLNTSVTADTQTVINGKQQFIHKESPLRSASA